jgi:hypothetical protein
LELNLVLINLEMAANSKHHVPQTFRDDIIFIRQVGWSKSSELTFFVGIQWRRGMLPLCGLQNLDDPQPANARLPPVIIANGTALLSFNLNDDNLSGERKLQPPVKGNLPMNLPGGGNTGAATASQKK